MEVRSPAVIKLFGEHAVVYGKTAVAAAVSFYATASVAETGDETLTIVVTKPGSQHVFSKNELILLYDSYKNRTNVDSFLATTNPILEKSPEIFPFAVIAARLYAEEKIDVLGERIIIESDIPKKKGMASSAARYVAFTTALLALSPKKLSNEKIIDIALDGERITHRNEGAGKIDVPTSFYGGYVSYDKINGAKKLSLPDNTDILIVDTGPKKSTAQTVGHIQGLHRKDQNGTELILEEMNSCSLKGMEALKIGDMVEVGKNMFKTHQLLAKLGVSTENLDKAVEVARKADAYGAKLSGGGGGGILIAIGENPTRLAQAMRKEGFEVSLATVAGKGAESYLKSKSVSRN